MELGGLKVDFTKKDWLQPDEPTEPVPFPVRLMDAAAFVAVALLGSGLGFLAIQIQQALS